MKQFALLAERMLELNAPVTGLKWYAHFGQMLFPRFDPTTGCPSTSYVAMLHLDPKNGQKPKRLDGGVFPDPKDGVVTDPDGWKYITVSLPAGDDKACAEAMYAAFTSIAKHAVAA